MSCAPAPAGYQLSPTGTCAIEPCQTAQPGEYYTDGCDVSSCHPPGPGRRLLDGTINTAGARTSPDSCLSGPCDDLPVGQYYGSDGCALHNCTNAPPGSCYLGHGGVDGNCPYTPCTNETRCPDRHLPPAGWHFSGSSQAERCDLVPCPVVAGKVYLSHAQNASSCNLVRTDCTNARLGESYVALDATNSDPSTGYPHNVSCGTAECPSECPNGTRLSEPGSCICEGCPVPVVGYYHAQSTVAGECAYARCDSPGYGEIAGVGPSFSPSQCPMSSCYRPNGSTFKQPGDCQSWALCSNNLPPGRYFGEGELGPGGECPTSACTAELKHGEFFCHVPFATANSHCRVCSPPATDDAASLTVGAAAGGGIGGFAALAVLAWLVVHQCRRRSTGRLFLSYRVNADARLVEKVYYRLRSEGVDVWWDKKCLEPGQPWEDSFADGLMGADVFVPFLSKTALAPFQALESTSRCDNVLLEYRLAAELKARGELRAIFPVFVGEPKSFGARDPPSASSSSTRRVLFPSPASSSKRRARVATPAAEGFGNFFADGGDPQAPGVQVLAVEAKVAEHLSRNGLGATQQPTEERTVKAVMDAIKRHQGVFLEGSPEADVIEKVVLKLKYLAAKSGRPMVRLSWPTLLMRRRNLFGTRSRVALRRSPSMAHAEQRIGRAELALRV